ncbi:MAG: sigma-70 family RNA polymerase sigma factor [Clostridia bacterium]|nr:sigma-70 family RNA polymerase sigma factor [Clostridia bacterium]
MITEEIVNRCRNGDKEAFRELFMSIEKKALATAYHLSGNRGIAEDILQETYIKCFTEIQYLRNPQFFNTWFFRVLIRTGWEMSKKHSRLLATDTVAEAENKQTDSFLQGYEERYLVRNAIHNLSQNLKTVVILYYYNDMSIEEISQVLNCLKATVKSRLFYARTVLKKQLNEHFRMENCCREVSEKGWKTNG